MGYLIAIAFGLAYQPLSKSQVVQGKLSLAITFWLYAIVIGGVIYGVAMWNFSSSISDFDGDPEGALRQGVFVAGYYSLFVFFALWRSSKQAVNWSNWSGHPDKPHNGGNGGVHDKEDSTSVFR